MNNQSNHIAHAYIRVSTMGQVADGVSLDAQRARIESWCTANGYRLADVHVDAGVSGKRADNRPGLQEALQAVCRARGTALVVYSLSRLARSTRDAINIAERLDKAGADLVSLSERIDTTTAAGKMIFRLLAVLAEFERDLVSERTRAALSYKRSNGERVSGRIPYGFVLADDGVRLNRDEHEQEVIRRIHEWRNAGLSYERIARRLNDDDVPAKRGGPWFGQTIRQIIARD